MSGGVDSSTVAHLLTEQGHEVIGVMMQLWTDPLAPTVRRALPKKCCSVEHIQRARAVCKSLDVPFYVTNMEQEFKEQVVDPYLQDHEAGKTPNPCIRCNRTIKFGMLLEKMHELDCDMIATGHYARITKDNSHFSLHEAKDSTRDQSYYLYTLTQEKMKHILFPLGDMLKSEVFELAKKFGVPIPEYYAESEDLCFYPEREPNAFLKRHLPSIQPGPIVTSEGEEVGTHQGLPLYTIGQRKGLGIGGLKIPLHVTAKKPEQNTLVVAPAGKDLRTSLTASSLNWIHTEPEDGEEIRLHARINSLGTKWPGVLTKTGDYLSFTFDEGVRGIAAGQSIVLYRGDEVLGGGEICDQNVT